MHSTFRLFLFFGLFFFGQCVWAQSPSIILTDVSSTAYCGGVITPIRFTTTGQFPDGNAFKVQLMTNYGLYTDLPGSFTASPALVRMPDFQSSYTPYLLRVVATKTNVSSNETPVFRLDQPVSVSLAGTSAGDNYVNPATPVIINVLSPNSSFGYSYTLTLSDSTRYAQRSDVYDNFYVRPTQTTSYSLVSVQNACGYGTVINPTETAIVKVNKIDFRLVQLAPKSVCPGGKVYAYFSTASPLPTETKFVAEFVRNISGKLITQTVSITGNTSPLEISVPTSLTPSYDYTLRVISTNSGIGSSYTGAYDALSAITVFQPPTARLLTPNPIRLGEPMSLKVEITGGIYGGKTTVWLNDGSSADFYSSLSGSVESIPINPTKTTIYSIVGVASNCGSGLFSGSATVSVGVQIDSLSSYKICSGDTLHVYFGSNTQALPTDPAAYTLTFLGNTRPNPNRYAYFQLQGVKLQNRRLSVVLTNSAEVREQYVQLSVGSPALVGPIHNRLISIGNNAPIVLQPISTTIATPQPVLLRVGDSAWRDHTIVLSDSSSVLIEDVQNPYWQGTLTVFPKKTTSYSIFSYSNRCGTAPFSGTATVTVLNPGPPALYLQPVAARYCPGATIPIRFTATGVFPAGNEFTVELSAVGGVFIGNFLATRQQDGSVLIPVPTKAGTYKLRVNATGLTLQSNEVTFYTGAPSAGVGLYFTGYNLTPASNITVATGQLMQLVIQPYSVFPYSFSVWDGRQTITGTARTTIELSPTATTTYQITGSRDACGSSGGGLGSATVTVIPFSLQFGQIPYQVCAGTSLAVPFDITGKLPFGTTFTVQASADGRTYRDLTTTGAGSPLQVAITPDMTGSSYYIRIVTKLNGNTIYVSEPQARDYSYRFQVISVPTLPLSGSNAATAIQITGRQSPAPPWPIGQTSLLTTFSLVLADGNIRSYGDSVTLSVAPLVGNATAFSLLASSNVCGYGPVSGSLPVKPGYRYLANLSNTANICAARPWSVDYETFGEFNPDNKFTFYLVGQGTRTAIGTSSAPKGTVSSLPSTRLVPGIYSLTIESSSPVVTANDYARLSIQQPPSTTLTGDLTALSRQKVDLFARTENAPATALLSNGQIISLGYSSTIPVNVSQTTSFSIVNIVNACGSGRTTGSATIRVLPDSPNTIQASIDPYSTYFCAGSNKGYVGFKTTGVFDTGNVFTVYVSDSLGINYRPLPTKTFTDYATVDFSVDLPVAYGYRLKVLSSKPVVESTTSAMFNIRRVAANLTGTNTIFKGDSARLNIALTGSYPWSVTLGNANRTITIPNILKSPYQLTVKPDTTTEYRLLNVYNYECETGTVSGTALITVTRILATDPTWAVSVFPNPTHNALHVIGPLPRPQRVTLTLNDAQGRRWHEWSSEQPINDLTHDLDLANCPAGVYLLTVSTDEQRTEFRVLKP